MGRFRNAARALAGRPYQMRAISKVDVWGRGGDTDLLPGGAAGTLSLVPLYSAIRLITDQFASTPLHGYRIMPDGSRQQLPADPAVLTPVNGSRATWKTQLITGLLTRGNAVGIHTSFLPSGWPASTVWVDPGLVSCDDLNPAAPLYWYNGRQLLPGEFVHIPWIVLPGKSWGLSPLEMFKTMWETGQAAQVLARNFYDSGGVPSGHLKNTLQEDMDEEEAERAKARFRASVSGRDVLVTGSDWTYDAIGLPADQLAFVQSMKLTATQIASIYGIAPEDIGGEAAAGLQYSTVEMNEIKLSTRTMRPWYSRVEDGLECVVPRGQEFGFDADALVRADLKTRMEAHEIATRIGEETNDEMRRAESKSPLTEAQKAEWIATYRQPAAAAAQTRELTE